MRYTIQEGYWSDGLESRSGGPDQKFYFDQTNQKLAANVKTKQTEQNLAQTIGQSEQTLSQAIGQID